MLTEAQTFVQFVNTILRCDFLCKILQHISFFALRLLVSGHLQKEHEFYSNFVEGGRTVQEFCSQVSKHFYREVLTSGCQLMASLFLIIISYGQENCLHGKWWNFVLSRQSHEVHFGASVDSFITSLMSSTFIVLVCVLQ